MFDQLSAEILASLIKGFPRTTTTTTTTTKQNVDPAVHFVYSRVKIRPFRPSNHTKLDMAESAKQVNIESTEVDGRKSVEEERIQLLSSRTASPEQPHGSKMANLEATPDENNEEQVDSLN
jgi:hypothetical protein